MERLIYVLFVAMTFTNGIRVEGQEQNAASGSYANPAGQGWYVVVGDVQNCNQYVIAPSERLTVRDAVLRAGLLTEAAGVSVIRGADDRPVWTQRVSRTTAETGELVVSGDILLVQSQQPIAAPLRKNAALRTDAGVIVLALVEDGITVGDVLRQSPNLHSPDGNVRILTRMQGHPSIANATPADRVLHGDIISVHSAQRRGLAGFGNMKPVVSEWAGISFGSAVDSVGFPEMAVPLVPTGDQLRNPHPPAPVAQPRESADSARETTAPHPPLEERSDEQSAERVDPMDVSDSTNFMVHSPYSVHTVSQSASIPARDSGAYGEVAPAPPLEDFTEFSADSMEPGAASSGWWNTLFIGGLMIAGLLILAGSLRAELSASMSPQTIGQGSGAEFSAGRTDYSPGSLTTPEANHQNSVLNAPESAASQVTITKRAEDTAVYSEPRSDSAIAAQLVATNEWFGHELHSRAVSANPEVPRESNRTEPPVFEFSTFERPPRPALAPEPEDLPEKRGAAYLMEALVRESLDRVSGPVPGAESRSLPETQTDGTPSGEEVRGRSDVLDDLILNRLPVDLCETRLPLKIALYGKPAGPRRLRIDAAHTAVPAPHIPHSSNHTKEDVEVMVTANAAPEQVVTPSESSAPPALKPRSLDRALNSLHNRIDS